jgi:hypothetical protein
MLFVPAFLIFVQIALWSRELPPHSYFRDSPLNELARKRPTEVISRYSTSATKVGSTHVALGFRIAFVSLDLGLTTVSSCFLIWLETVRDHPVPPPKADGATDDVRR